MTDYAAAPSQPIAQGLVTVFPQEVGVPILSFFGKGIVPSGPQGPVAMGTGDYLLTLDAGLPGDVAIDPPFGRFMLTVRATTPGTPTTVVSKSLSYIPSVTPGVGATQVRVEFAIEAGTAFDPPAFEIIIWRADAGVELTNANLIGFPSVIFP